MEYRIIEEGFKTEDILRLYAETYWANKRSREDVEKILLNSDCYGVMVEDKLIGFARIISDHVTTYYLADVIVLEAYRGNGFGYELCNYILSKEEFRHMKGILLTTTAYGLYEKFGFNVINNRAMLKDKTE